MKKSVNVCLITFLVSILLNAAVFGRSNYDNQSSKGSDLRLILPSNRLPSTYGFQYTDEIAAAFTCYGTFGSNIDGPYYFDYHYPSFMSPKGNHQDYLYGGSIWIGGIIGEDTLVTLGNDGWRQPIGEFYPPKELDFPAVTEIESPADFAMHAEFYDTLDLNTAYPVYFPIWDPPYIPLNLRVGLRSHTWHDSPNNQTVIYDMVITNVGEETIREGRIGLFFDGDAYDYNNKGSGSKDDLSGSIRDKGIAYIIDNDGDPIDGFFDEVLSPTRCLAVKFIDASFVPRDTIFNWWISHGTPYLDFGPRQKGTDSDPFRPFYAGNLGTPYNDFERYYLLSHPEWDYDQCYSATIGAEDDIWMEPNPDYSADYATRGDTRFLLSIGPVDIEPDSSIRVSFATFTGNDVHHVVDNFDNLPYYPDTYLSNLDFTGVTQNADISDQLARRLLNPLNPVPGLRVDYHDKDSAIIQWDPWVYDGIDGYEIFLSKIDFDRLPYPGVIPPWLEPEHLCRYASIDEQTNFTITELNSRSAYFVNAASRSGWRLGDPGKPVIIFDSTRAEAPAIKDDFVFSQTGAEATIEWDVTASCHIDHFNIYKFESEDDAKYPYHAYYRDWFHPYLPVADSMFVDDTWYYYCAMEIYGTVGKNARCYTDYNVNDGATYIITSVDKRGFESEFSDPIVFQIHTPPTRDILFITGNGGYPDYRVDTVINFYKEILSGYDYDIIDYSRELIPEDCQEEYPIDCYDWRDFEPYRYLIMDSPINFECFRRVAEDKRQPLTRYVLSGGKLIYFGMLFSVAYNYYDTTFRRYPDEFLDRFTAIDSLFSLQYDFYYLYNYYGPYIDTLAGLVKAESVISEAPDLDFDTDRDPYPDYVKSVWAGETTPGSAAFTINDKGISTHLYRSKYPDKSRAEGYPVGIKTVTDEAITYLYGFHLWYMEPSDARALINYITGNSPTDLNDNDALLIPESFDLGQNYPNPFNASTEIKYSLPTKTDLNISIYNILGQEVKTILHEEKPAGYYTVHWDGTDMNNRPTASGIYLYQIKAGDFSATKKMLLLK